MSGATLENAAVQGETYLVRSERRRRVHEQRIAIQRKHRAVERKPPDSVPHPAAHQQKVAAGVGMQVTDVPLRRMRHSAVSGAVQALEMLEKGPLFQFLEILGGECHVATIAA